MKKILMVLIAFIFLITFSDKVNALQDSFYEGEYIPNTYMKKFNNTSGRYQQMKVFRRKSDNHFVYCIELWEELQSNKMINGYDNNQYLQANIDYSVWEKIMLISYYGYGYGNHTDIKWYAITQFMIWQVTSPTSTIYFTDTLNGNKITKYTDEMNEINSLISKHGDVPSFYNKTYQVKYNEPFTVTDTNNVLDKFEITSDGGLNPIKLGNNLTITNKRVGESSIFFTNSDKKYNTNPIVYIDSAGQDVMVPGSYYPIYMIVNYELPSATVTINKLDNDTGTIPQGEAQFIESAFQLLDEENNVVQESKVEKGNKAKFKNIGYGTYYLKEIKAGLGYQINDRIEKIMVDNSTEGHFFYNKVIKNKIIINKYIKNNLTGEVLPEEKATFSIYNNNQEKVLTFNTNENGYYEVELPYGSYTIKQESGLKNHSFVDDLKVSIIENNQTQTFDIYNERLYANIKIINLDYDSNLPILESGATFIIKDILTNDYLLDSEKEILILNTNELGETCYLPVSSGKYQIEQLTSVNSYQLAINNLIFEISDETKFDQNNNENYLLLSIPNLKEKSIIEFEKLKEYYLNDELIKTEIDQEFEIDIYAKEDIYSKDGIKLYVKDEIVDAAKLLTEKVQTSPLVFGNYYIKSPIDNSIIEIILDSIKNEKIILIEKEYEYEIEEPIIEDIIPEPIPDDEPTDELENIIPDTIPNDEYINQQETIISETIITDVPNTSDNKTIINNFELLIIITGIILIKKGNKNETN